MSLASPPMIGLDLEDFRRLGVRPHECRLTVIRRAAARSSKALAERQLTEPSPQVGLQLSRVATSAYRLLDPRQRPDPAQRAHVGRILPNTLSGAGQTSFHSTSGGKSFDKSFVEGADDDAELIEALDLDMSPRPSSSGSSLMMSLSDDDILDSRIRRSARARARARMSWVWLALGGLTAGTLLGLATKHHSDRAPVTATAALDDPPNTIAAPAVERLPTQRSPMQDLSPSAVEASPPQPAPATPPVQQVEAPSEIDVPRPTIEVPTAADVDHAGSQTDAQTQQPSAAATVPSEDGSRLALDASPSRRDIETVGPMEDSASFAADGFLPDPFMSRDAPPEQAEITEPKISPIKEMDLGSSIEDSPSHAAPPATTEGHDDVPRHSVPDESAARDARTQLVLLLPELAKSVVPDDVEERIAQVEALEKELAVGSADHWAARMFVAELAWLVEDLAGVRQRLKPLTENYDTPELQPLAKSFVAACDNASLPETHQHLIGNGLRLADQLLIHESPGQCKQVIDAMVRSKLRARSEDDPSTEATERDSLRDYLEDFSQAAAQMQRLGESARRIRSEDGKVDDSRGDVGILGRYYCLMLRQWDVGLPWLVEVSDSRIASAARGEIELDEAASPDALIDLAQHWVSVASRSRGRASDSMRLHSIEILRRTRALTSGLKQLEVERKIDATLQLLPPFLRETTPSPEVPSKHSAAAKVQESDKTVASNAGVKSGLSGRITIDGEDIGVQLNYELGVAMTQTMLDAIAEKLDRTLTRMTIEFDGRFELNEPANVIVSIAPSPQDLTQAVRIDDGALQFDPQTMTAEIALSDGEHRIDWSIEAERIALATLRLRDSVSGQQIVTAHPPSGPADPTRRNALTVAMVRGTQ